MNDRSEWRDYILCFIVGAIVVAILAYQSYTLKYPLENDTSGYVQEARNFLQGDGLIRATLWDDTDRQYAGGCAATKSSSYATNHRICCFGDFGDSGTLFVQ